MFDYLRADIKAVRERDPAARSSLEVFFLYPSIAALFWHRVAHRLYNIKLMFLSRMISQLARFFTGIEIHPGAKIGKGCFIDHGMGVIIGETAEVGENCTIYQGVTLGGTGKDVGKRHPTLGNNVMVGSGAKVLGPFKVGDNSKIAANAVVLNPVPPNSTCVGVPARVVKVDNIRVKDELDQTHIPDPVSQELCKILHRVHSLEKELEKLKKEGKENENI
ncbi:MAG: serine O-acetyltransferase [Ruminococcaceae bacterium]|nr:serine O-acetyltransferase [Oscillospiraceae bacterium]